MRIFNNKYYDSNNKLKNGSEITLASFMLSLTFGIIGLIAAIYHLGNLDDRDSFITMIIGLIFSAVFNWVGKKFEKIYKL